MGGILLRYYFEQNTLENLGHVVMLGPPNQGSEAVDKLKGLALFKRINGPAGVQLGTGKNDIPAQLNAVNFNVGIIAGKRSINPILSLLIPGPDDGKVAVLRSKVDGMTAHKVLPVTHTFMMRNKTVMAEVLHFLQYGAFL